MSRKPENTFIASIHRRLPIGLHIEKMANPYRGGTADVWYSGLAGDLWVEYKYIERIPKKVPIKPGISELQRLWLNGRHNEGRNVAVIVGCSDGGVILRNKDWEGMIHPTEFCGNLVSRDDIANWIRGEVHKRSEAGENNDSIFSRNLPSAGKALTKSGRETSNLRGPVRAPRSQRTGGEREPRL